MFYKFDSSISSGSLRATVLSGSAQPIKAPEVNSNRQGGTENLTKLLDINVCSRFGYS